MQIKFQARWIGGAIALSIVLALFYTLFTGGDILLMGYLLFPLMALAVILIEDV